MKKPENTDRGFIKSNALFALSISVSGPTGYGKSTAAFIIEKALCDAGALVTVETEDRCPEEYRKTLKSRTAMMKGKTIRISERRDQSSYLQ